MPLRVDIDFESHEMFIDGVQVNKTPKTIVPHDSNKKSKHPVILKIIVGQACNYNCKYCCQFDKQKFEPSKIKELLERLDNTLCYDKLHEVQIWGGEPLLYFDGVVQICDHFYKKNAVLSIITNGSKLTKEIVTVLNIYDVNVCISHDGPAQTKVRGEDPLTLHKDIIKDIKHLTIACCLTKDNYDLCEINDWFYDKFTEIGVKIKNVLINYNIVEVHDERSRKLAIVDLPKFQLCLRMFFDRCREKDPKIIWNTFYHNMTEGSVAKLCQDIVRSEPIIDCTGCCLEFDEIIIVDNNGYIRECQNLNDTYNIGVLEDLPNKMYEKDARCKECVYKNLCQGVCPIIPKEYFNINCSANMARFEVVADFSLKIIEKEVIDIAKNHKY